jgi:hypothetical protein
MMMTDKKKLPPMAKAAREFLAGVQLPPSNHTDTNIKLAALFGAMLFHCSSIQNDAEAVTCSPSQRQIAELLHCSIPAVERLMRKARGLGFLTKRSRGTMSCVYTIYKAPQQTHQLVMAQTTHQQVMAQDTARPITSAPLTHHLGTVDPSLPPVDPSTSVRLRGKASGILSQEKNPQGMTRSGCSVFSREEPVSDSGSVPSAQNSMAAEKLPAGIVRINGRLVRVAEGR